jgi:hypothetical protein
VPPLAALLKKYNLETHDGVAAAESNVCDMTPGAEIRD